MVFDCADPAIHKKPFRDRYQFLSKNLKQSETLKLVEHTVCKSREDLDKFLKKVEGLKGEGVMLRNGESAYVHGRSHELLKVKTFHDAEATVIGME